VSVPTMSIATATQLLHALPIANYSGFAYYLTVCPPAGVNEITDMPFKLYPNPATTTFTIDNEMGRSYTMELVNILGERIMEYFTNSRQRQYNISKLAPGIYEVLIRDDKEALRTLKIIKQ